MNNINISKMPQADYSNNFGFLRLAFAALVVLSHSPELIDGNRSREILTNVFGTISFGELGVDGFFLISGYLITKSYLQSQSTYSYLIRRVFRIYPAYIVAYLVSLFLVGPLVGGDLSSVLAPMNFIKQPVKILFLQTPWMDGSFENLPHQDLNGSMWTILYEFKCYLLVMFLGWLGLYRMRIVYLLVSAVFIFTHFLGYYFPDVKILADHTPAGILGVAGSLQTSIRLFAAFLVGGAFFVFNGKIKFRDRHAALAAVLLVVLLFFKALSEVALITLGGYVLFWFALHFKNEYLSKVGTKVDISYGLYLYAWPLQSVIIYFYRDISPGILSFMAISGASIAGYLSWKLIEFPSLTFGRKF